MHPQFRVRGEGSDAGILPRYPTPAGVAMCFRHGEPRVQAHGAVVTDLSGFFYENPHASAFLTNVPGGHSPGVCSAGHDGSSGGSGSPGGPSFQTQATAPRRGRNCGGTPITQLRICGDGRNHVARHVNFRNQGDVPAVGKRDDCFDILLAVGSAVRRFVISPRPVAFVTDERCFPHGTDFGQPGILLDLDSPALVFGKMKVTDVKPPSARPRPGR